MADLPLASLFPAANSEDWLKRVDAVLKGESFAERLAWQTADGLRYDPLYGQTPGPRAERQEVAPWLLIQRVDHTDAAKANVMALDDLANGATGLAIVTTDAMSARGFGVAPSRIPRILKDVQLHAIALRVEGTGAAALADYIATQPIDPERLNVSFAATPEIASDLNRQGFRGPLVEVDGRPWHEKGASPAEELGAIIAEGVALLRRLGKLDDEALARSVGMALAADQDMFTTLAKFRAIRILWSRVLAECRLPQVALALHGETSWRMQAIRDPHTNILRATAAVFGAGLGGASSICVLPMSLAQGLPNAFARRVARNVQNLLIEESHLWRVADPASGSGYVERLTSDLCEAAWRVFQRAEGGMWPEGDHQSQSSKPVIGTTAYPLEVEYRAEVEAA